MDIKLTQPQFDFYELCNSGVIYPLFVGGYGSGKSYILIINAIKSLFSFDGCRIAVYSPTFDLMMLNLIPRFCEVLSNLGIDYKLNKSNYIIEVDGGNQIIFRSMGNPERIVAYEVYNSFIDEIDLLNNVDKTSEVWDRILGRNRQINPDIDSHLNQISAYTTPEGFGFSYQKWGKEPKEGYSYVRAETKSNFYLDKSFVRNLQNTYSDKQVQAYLKGYWVNIYSGTVYDVFDRNIHNTDRIIKNNDVLHIGVDFNVGGCAVAVFIEDGDKIYMVDEFLSYNTNGIVKDLNTKYNNKIIIYPDATGKKETSNASESDISILKDAGFQIRAKKSNPRVKDRVNSVNALFRQNRLFINVNRCSETVLALEQQSYDKQGKPEKFNGPGTVDDRNDAFGYYIAYKFPIKSRKIKKIKYKGI